MGALCACSLLILTGLAAGLEAQQRNVVKLAVIAPADPRHEQSLPRLLPAVLMAVRAVSAPRGSLPGWRIEVEHRDSQCSSTYGPLAAFDFYINRTAGSRLSLCPVTPSPGEPRHPIAAIASEASLRFGRGEDPLVSVLPPNSSDSSELFVSEELSSFNARYWTTA
jgi:hypothetical protein